MSVVYGRFDSPVEAEQLLDEVLRYGLLGTEVYPDDCGRYVVELRGVPSIVVGQEVVEEARTVYLEPTLELDPSG